MNLRKKTIVVLLLIALTLFSMELLSGLSITIKGKGRGVTEWDLETGSWTFRCDNSSQDDCTLTVHYPTP